MINERLTVERLADARFYAEEVYRIASQSDARTSSNDHLAIRYCLVVIGETLGRVPTPIFADEVMIPWSRIIGLRHRLVHGYWLIDADIIDEIARHETQPLITALDRLIEKLKA